LSLPHLLLVDDSDAILAYEKAALGGEYLCTTASDGGEALRKAIELRPDGVLLDLSMPVMSGDEVLLRLKADPSLKDIPVVVISSEKQRGEDCLGLGAAAFLPKPIKAEELKSTIARVLEQSRQQERKGSLAVLMLGVGALDFAIPLDGVSTVVLQPATQTLASGPSYLREIIDLHGQPVPVLDMARPLRTERTAPLADRKLVVITHEGRLLALSVDRVRDPEEFLPEALVRRTALVGSPGELLSETLIAIARSARGPLPILDPAALWSRRALRELPKLLEKVSAGGTLEASTST
jgi:CheY-like chemotaxis protein/chemotaxis signal transduction protein